MFTRLIAALMALACATALAANAAAPDRALHVIALFRFPGGENTDREKIADGASLEYSDAVTVAYSGQLDPHGVKATLSPDAPFEARSFGAGVLVQWRKVPGVTYTVVLDAVGANGEAAPPQTYHFSTPALTAYPKPIRHAEGPYRYGTLEHYYDEHSLMGANRERKIRLDADAGVRFARVDYAGRDIEPAKGRFDWTLPDAALKALLAAGITEMPNLVQYGVAPWATDGRPYPAVWTDPRDFAEFAGAVAAHLKAFPRVERIEIFNEPNLCKWAQFPTNTQPPTADAPGGRRPCLREMAAAAPRMIDVTGATAAAYMQAAYRAIKAANPRLVVVGPALASGGQETDPRAFFGTMYAAGCKTGSCWDVLSIHAYDSADPDVKRNPHLPGRIENYRDLQEIARAHGDPTPHVMLTEHAYSTAMRADAFDPHVQALYEAKLFNHALADPTIDGVVWTNIDIGYRRAAADFFGTTSLVDNDGKPLPAYDVYREFAK